MREPRFPLGRIVITAHASSKLRSQDVQRALQRHASGDWGKVHPEDEGLNDQALRSGDRLLSVYQSSTGETFWIITERDRSITTILMPEDY